MDVDGDSSGFSFFLLLQIFKEIESDSKRLKTKKACLWRLLWGILSKQWHLSFKGCCKSLRERGGERNRDYVCVCECDWKVNLTASETQWETVCKLTHEKNKKWMGTTACAQQWLNLICTFNWFPKSNRRGTMQCFFTRRCKCRGI